MESLDPSTDQEPKPAVTPTTASSAFKVGLLCDSTAVSKYVYDLATWIVSQPNLSVVLIIHKNVQAEWNTTLRGRLGKLIQTTTRNGFFSAFSKVLFRLLTAIEEALLKLTRHKDHTRVFDIASVVSESITIEPIVSKSGLVYRFSASDLQRVKGLNCDVLIRCGRGILRGDILRAARHGILSFHHGDNRINRGGPPGFWEVYRRQDTTGFTIQRLTEELDGGVVFMRGHFQTKFCYQLNQATLLERSNYFMKGIIQDSALRDSLPPALPSLPYSEQLFRSPHAGQTLLYSLRLLARLVPKVFEALTSYRLRWHVAFLRSDWRSAVLWRATELKNPPLHFLADPFVISRNGKDYCFVEDFDYGTQRGSIAVYELAKNGGVRIGTALAEDFHLSFPFLFEYQGELFMCPESSAAKEIRIYKCVEFPLRWKLEAVTMQNVKAVDSVIFEQHGRWWLLTNIDPLGTGEYRSELFAFHAPSPFGKWVAHPLNPILVDAACAGNAGLLVEPAQIFRVSQGQGFDFYGRQAQINEVVELTPHSYREAAVARITPTFKRGVAGVHHLHSNGSVTVFDYVRRSRITK